MLRRDLCARPRGVQRDGRHLAAQVVHPEHQVVGQRVAVPPDRPADAGVDQPVLVARRINGAHPRQPEVPHQVRIAERGDHRAGRAVHVHRDVPAVLGLHFIQRRADLRDRLVAAVERRAEDRDHADPVGVTMPHDLVGGQVEPIALHGHQPRLDLPVVRELLPAHLNVDAHHGVRPAGAVRVLPAALHREAGQHARLTGPDRRAAGRAAGLRHVPQIGEDVHAARLQLTNVARLSRALPSSISSSCTTW